MSLARCIAAIVAVLVLSGCSAVDEVVAPSPSATTTPTPTQQAPTPAEVVLSVDQISVLDSTGATLTAARYADPEAVLALLSSVEGSTPDPVDNKKFGVRWEWPDVALTSSYWAFVGVTGAQIGGLPVQTTQGIHVGSTRADLEALDAHDWGKDLDGDGKSDYYCLDVRPEPGKQSLVDPTMEGITCVGVTLAGDTVTSISSMSNDWFDN